MERQRPPESPPNFGEQHGFLSILEGPIIHISDHFYCHRRYFIFVIIAIINAIALPIDTVVIVTVYKYDYATL